jgi:hypothetical protein
VGLKTKQTELGPLKEFSKKNILLSQGNFKKKTLYSPKRILREKLFIPPREV